MFLCVSFIWNFLSFCFWHLTHPKVAWKRLLMAISPSLQWPITTHRTFYVFLLDSVIWCENKEISIYLRKRYKILSVNIFISEKETPDRVKQYWYISQFSGDIYQCSKNFLKIEVLSYNKKDIKLETINPFILCN